MNSITEKAINKHVELRLKFQQNTLLSQAEITDRLRALNLMNKFQFKASEEYILLSFKKNQKIHTPQLQLRIENDEAKNMNQIHFLFGPDSGLWTMFMFLHFGLGVFFLGIGIWLYTNISLNKPFGLLTAILIIIILGWVGLYFCARTYGERGNLKQEN